MFEYLEHLSPDPLLGIIERFRVDRNPNKIDLGVGVYKDDWGQTPVLRCVKSAESFLLKEQASKSYLGPLGDQTFTQSMCELVMGDEREVMSEGRTAVLQTPGGCGALRVAAELIVRAKPGAKVWVSDPTWANHVPLLCDAGISIATYPYYDYVHKSIRFEEMLDTLRKADVGDLVLLHGCCHNPCGADLSAEQWLQTVEVMLEKRLVPFVDMAYQGFGQGLDQDALGLRLVLKRFDEAVFTVSCSKNFGLYRDRVGVVGFMLKTDSHAMTALTNLTQIVRGIYSMPPDHGAAVVAHILNDNTLRDQWVAELAQMRSRINAMRAGMAKSMAALGCSSRFDFVTREHGMFSFLGITEDQVSCLASNFGIYLAASSRINVAGLNQNNLDYFCQSLSSVLASA